MNLRCCKCQLVFLVNTFEDVRIIQAMSCSEGAGHKLSEVVCCLGLKWIVVVNIGMMDL